MHVFGWCSFLPRNLFNNPFAVRHSWNVGELPLVVCKANPHALADFSLEVTF